MVPDLSECYTVYIYIYNRLTSMETHTNMASRVDELMQADPDRDKDYHLISDNKTRVCQRTHLELRLYSQVEYLH